MTSDNNVTSDNNILGLDLMSFINDDTLVGKVAREEYTLNDAIIEDENRVKNSPPKAIMPIAGNKTAIEILGTNTDAVDLSLDAINPNEDKYLKDMKFVWRRKDDGKMYIYNNTKNTFTSETRGERYKYIPPTLVELIIHQPVNDVQFNGNIFSYTFSTKNKTIYIVDNHMSINDGMLFIDGEMYSYKHTESDVMKIISFIMSLDKSKLL